MCRIIAGSEGEIQAGLYFSRVNLLSKLDSRQRGKNKKIFLFGASDNEMKLKDDRGAEKQLLATEPCLTSRQGALLYWLRPKEFTN
jgi:hypothetical protein